MPESIENFQLRDFATGVKAPTVHIARGYEQSIPILAAGRPIVCISDWQCETSTQRYFWEQVWRVLTQQVGGNVLERALVIVAGDMASKGNNLRGTKSDDAPDYSWLQESFPNGDIMIVYGNHDLVSREHLLMKNQGSGLPCLLPHGSWLGVPAKGTQYNVVSDEAIGAILDESPVEAHQVRSPQAGQPSHVPEFLQYMTKEERSAYYAKQSFPKKARGSQKTAAAKGLQWERENPEQNHLTSCFRRMQSLVLENVDKLREEETHSPQFRIGAVHGIPASHCQGIKKVEREEYFRALEQVCDPSTAPIDILVTHYQPWVPGQEEGFDKDGDDDPKRVYQAFLKSAACMHICGHRRINPPVTIVSNGKVVVNADCRVVVFVPPPHEEE